MDVDLPLMEGAKEENIPKTQDTRLSLPNMDETRVEEEEEKEELEEKEDEKEEEADQEEEDSRAEQQLSPSIDKVRLAFC